MNIQCTQRDDVTIVAVEGVLDVATAPILQKGVKELVAGNQTRLIFDFSDLDHITSSGLAVLVMSLQLLKPKNGLVAVAGADGLTKEVIGVWAGKTHPFIPSFATVEQAMQYFAGKS